MSRETCVRFYAEGEAKIKVYFPNGMTVCQWCPYVRYVEGLRRHQCALTNEYLPYPFDSMGRQCPVVFDQNKEEENHEFDC